MYITRRERFNAAHRLFRKDWTDEKNAEIFGKCSNPNWHGHNYTLYVTVKGSVNPETGFVINLKDLSKLIKTKIIDKVDHKNLNIEVDFMKDKIVSTENVAIAFWHELKDDIRNNGAELHCIKLVETENNYVEYFGN
ncbi:MAG: 6-carboxytetrahydropterin synthase [Bacteroidales bacterium]